MIIAVMAVLGLCFGSFVNAFVWRIHARKDWVKDRSICPQCKHVLSALDLVPVFSWLVLGGKCRYCKKPISKQYPLVELATALLFVGSYVFWPDGFDARGIFNLAVWLIVCVGLMALVIYDFRWMLLPNKILFPLIGFAALAVIIDAVFLGGGTLAVRGAVLGLLTAAVPFYVLFIVSNEKWIGGGDVKLGILIGLIVGGAWRGILVIFLASLFGLLWALPGIAHHKFRTNSRIPFGPFLILGLCVVRLFGGAIISWYTRKVLYMP